MYDYNCPDCNEAKLQSDKNARKINEVIDQVNALIQVNNETVDFIEDKANEVVGEIAEIKVNEVIGELNTEIENIAYQLSNESSGNVNQDLQNALNNYNVVMIDKDINITQTIHIADREYIKILCKDNCTINHSNINLFKFERVKNIEIINCNIKGVYESGHDFEAPYCI